MNLPDLTALVDELSRYVAHGHSRTAARLLSDTTWDLVRAPFRLNRKIKYLVHYTSIDALFSLLASPPRPAALFPLSIGHGRRTSPDPAPFLGAYDTYNSADPNEGHFFVHTAPSSHSFLSQHSTLWNLLQERSRLPAYVASFRGVSSLADLDDLVFWQTYGNNGDGCAIVCPVSFFAESPLVLPVKYGSEAVLSTLDHLTTVFDALIAALTPNHASLLYHDGSVPPYVSTSLSPIPYIHKATDYAFEEEVRIVIPFVDLYGLPLYLQRAHDPRANLELRHFVNIPELHINKIFQTNSRIVLGPAVSSDRNLRFVLKQRLINLGLVGPAICGSRADYQP